MFSFIEDECTLNEVNNNKGVHLTYGMIYSIVKNLEQHNLIKVWRKTRGRGNNMKLFLTDKGYKLKQIIKDLKEIT